MRYAAFGWLILLAASGWAEDQLASLRGRASMSFGPALAELRNEADAAAKRTLRRIVDKTETPPSGDKRDYYDLSPYFWPNPNSADGLPYVFRDGKVNPEANEPRYDRVAYGEMGDAVRRLGLAYRLTGNEEYAMSGAKVIREWFLDTQTGMRPNFDFSQHIKGIPGGQPIGIIRGMTIVEIVEYARWLEESPHWTSQDQEDWRRWLADYAVWLQASDPGRKEADAFNNHGTWYDVQLVAALLATGQRDAAQRVLREVPSRRLAKQLKSDGSQPFELARTKSWDYSVMNLEAMFRLARFGESVGVDLWNWRDDEDRQLRKAIDYLVPFATGEQSWKSEQIRDFDAGKIYPLLIRAAAAYHDPSYELSAAKLSNFDPISRREVLQALAGVP